MGEARARLRTIMAPLLGAMLLASCGGVGVSHFKGTPENSANTPEISRPHWQLTLDDEFNGHGFPTGWTPILGGGSDGWSHNELQWNDMSNARLDGAGQLVITASHGSDGQVCWYGPCQYTAARIQTEGRFSQTYGIFEARIKLPPGHGLWPAFWLEGANINKVGWPRCGEADVIEFSDHRPSLVSGFAHGPQYSHDAHYSFDEPLTAGYHTYGIDWTPNGITWTFDGRAYSHMDSYPGWPFNHPFFLILDLAVGGAFAGSPEPTSFPAHLLVDWVRVYRMVK
jgi:beta-glucanase (GH16 family)